MNPIAALIIANIIWGAGSPIFKIALTNVPVFILVFARFFFAALIFLPYVLKSKYKLTFKDFRDLFFAGIIGISFHIPAYFVGIKMTQSINAPIIASASPVFLFFLSILLLKEKINYKVLYGMFLSLAGVILIVIAPIFYNSSLTSESNSIQGNLLITLSTIFSIFSVLIHKKVLNRVEPYVVAFWTFIFGTLPLLPFVYFEFQSWSPIDLNFYGAFGIIYGIFLNTALAYALYFFGMSKIKAQEVGTFTYVDPVIAILIAAPLLGEYPDKFFVIGTFFVFLGIYISEGRVPWHPISFIKSYLLKYINNDKI